MRLIDVAATPHASGHRIDVSWVNPDPTAYPGVRVVRRERTHPTSPDDGVVVAEGIDLPFTTDLDGRRSYTVPDSGLQGETVYYYTLFPYVGGPPDYQFDAHNRTSAMATATYDMAQQMYTMLPALYHRYDAVPAGNRAWPLRRFLEIPGSQLDLLYSFARAALHLHDIERVDGRLLPLLADWIGWDTNFRLEIAEQRSELRSAPYLYRTIGIVPTVEATVKRVLGWESRVKEFVHNVALSNAPERLNPWTMRRDADGVWHTASAPLSLDFDYEGRPAAATEQDGVLWFFYPTLRNGRWDIWYKTLTMFTLPASLQEQLKGGIVTLQIRRAFQAAGFDLPQDSTLESVHGGWEVTPPNGGERFRVQVEAGGLAVHRWTPSLRLTSEASVDKHPWVLFRDGTLYVFWDSWHEATGKWRICYRTRTGTTWSGTQTFGDDGADRKSPAVIADQAGRLWAFWMERNGSRWHMRYARESGGGVWNLDSSHDFPPDDSGDPQVHGEIFALFRPPGSAGGGPEDTPQIWVFWSRKVRIAAGQSRWQIAYRTATGIDPSEITWIHTWSPDFPNHRTVDTSVTPVDISFRTYYVNKPLDWSEIYTLPESMEDFSAREPAAFLNTDNELELFFSSDRNGSWSVWRTSLSALAPPVWQEPTRLTTGAFSHRAPFPCVIQGGTLLLYRSNESVRYGSQVYRATETVDARYAGSTTVDTRNLAKIALRERFDDFQTYVYDVGSGGVRTDRDWYARDTVGIYLDPPTEDQRTIVRNRNLITDILRQFLPAPAHVVFVIPITTREHFYTYDFPADEPQRLIREKYADQLRVPSAETLGGLTDPYGDTMVGWTWAYSRSENHPEQVTVDTTTSPVDTTRRTWHIGLQQGGQ